MRKLVMSLAAMLFMAGLVLAAEVTVVKYDSAKKEVTVKEGDKESTYKITDKTKVTITDKEGNTTEGKIEALTRRLENIDKSKNKKLDITTKGDEITEVKMRGGKKK
jgi:hypothetical protein